MWKPGKTRKERQIIWLGEARAHLVGPLACLLTQSLRIKWTKWPQTKWESSETTVPVLESLLSPKVSSSLILKPE